MTLLGRYALRAEELLDFLNSKPNPVRLGERMDLVTGAYADFVSRVEELERLALEQKYAVGQLTDRTLAAEKALATYQNDHGEYDKRIKAVETAPAANKEQLDKLDKRVSTVEGAVGSKGYTDKTFVKPVVQAQPDPINPDDKKFVLPGAAPTP